VAATRICLQPRHRFARQAPASPPALARWLPSQVWILTNHLTPPFIMLLDPFLIFGVFAALIGACVFVAGRRHVFLVHEGSIGVLFDKGKLSATLPAGRHVRWGRFLRLQPVEARRTLMQIAGQDVLTADNVSIKLSIVLTMQIVDAARALQAADNHFTHV
jgi:hypothetical protein